MNERPQLERLQRIAVFAQLSTDALASVLPYCSEQRFSPGEAIIREGDDSRQLYIILDGEVGVFKAVTPDSDGTPATGASADELQIGTLGAGEVVGEMRFIDPMHPRSASIRALRATEVLSLSYAAFETIAQQHTRTAYTFLRNLARLTNQNLRRTSEATVAALQRELDYANTHAVMGRFISYIVILLFAYNLTLQFTIRWSKVSHYANVVSFVIVAVFGLALVLMIKQTGAPLRAYGLTVHNWQRAVPESLLWTLGLLVLITALKWLLIETVPRYAGIPLFGPYDIHTTPRTMFTYGMYTLLAPVQEFIARGVMQTSFAWFYTGRHRTLLAILVSNALFAAAHVHLSATFAAVVFVFGLLWGYLYARQRTLLGVSLSHILLGLYGVFVLKLALLMQRTLY